jgi:hypothetical protein
MANISGNEMSENGRDISINIESQYQYRKWQPWLMAEIIGANVGSWRNEESISENQRK